MTLLLGALLAGGAAAAPASAATDDGLVWQAFVNERDAESVPPGNPVRLGWQEPTVIDIRVSNERDEPVSISRVRFEGRVLGLAFFSYTTDVDLELAPGDEGQRVYSLNMQDLYGQATGKLPGHVVLLDGRDEVATIDVPVRVAAPLRSVYGMFGVGVAGVTAVLLWGALWSLARGRLHPNRWRRATTLAVPGLGLGFTLTFTVSALGWFLPSGGLWLGLVTACGAAGFVVGYLTPTPDLVGDVDEDELDGIGDADLEAYRDDAGDGPPAGDPADEDAWDADRGTGDAGDAGGQTVLAGPWPGADLPDGDDAGQDGDRYADRPGDTGRREDPGQR